MLGILNIEKLTLKQKILLGVLILLGVFMLGSGRAHAATLNVTGSCTLPIAINSVNAGANQSGCTAGGSYGSSDTITIPAGTVTLTADLPQITENVSIVGAGMSSTIVDGDAGQYRAFNAETSQLNISGLKVTAFEGCAILTLNTNVVLNNIEVDGANATVVGNNYCGIAVQADSGSLTMDSNGLYVHNFTATGSDYIEGITIKPYGGSSIDADIQNTTFSDIHALSGGVNGIFMAAGFLESGGGTVTANIVNTTVDDVTSTAITAPFANIAFADGGDANTTVVVNNITITGTRGAAGTGFLTGLNTAAFYALGMGNGAGDTGTVNVSVGNSLMADNLLDSTPANCFEGDLTSNYGGSGTVVTSITSLGHNIADDNSCSFAQTGDKQNINNITSTLGALQNNGGNVPTRALLAGSPAINTGSQVLGITTDARGIDRLNDCPSVGAYQYEGAVCAASAANGGSGNSNGGSLAETGQDTKTNIVIGLLLVSTALATAFSRRKLIYKHR